MCARNGKLLRCCECGSECREDETRLVDDTPVCLTCLYGDITPVVVRPIGFVRKLDKHADDVSEIHLAPGMRRFMRGLADETHLTIVWQFHRQGPIKSVFSRGWDSKRVGPFASRTPHRLTPIAVTDVELLKVHGTTLRVRGLEAIDGTPVLDIKVSIKSLKRGGPRAAT